VSEVTVTVTLTVTVLGVPVMVKLFVAVVELPVNVKNGVEVATSSFAIISIFTPDAGIVDLIVTTSGKSGPGEGAWLLFAAGVNSTESVASFDPPPLLFLQLPLMIAVVNINNEHRYRTFLISRLLGKI